MHILHVVPTLKAGGMEMALSRVVKGLMAVGITHTIVVLKGEAIIRDQFDPEVNIHCVHAQSNGLSVPLRLRRLIQEERPTVIHARNLGAWPEVALARLSVWPLVPLIFSFHGVAEAKPVPWRWRLMSRILAYTTRVIFTVSQGSKQFLTDHVGLSASRVAVIPNGVDTTRFYPLANRQDHQEYVIGTVGSLTPVKNQALLIKACHRLMLEGISLRIEIAGEGPERQVLENLIQALGIAEKVKLVGHIADTPAFLRHLDVFALPSDSEAHPNALSEAMACGLPCIASRVGGIPEILNEGLAGMLFDPGDEEGLANGLKILMTNKTISQELGNAAWKRTCEQYSMAIMLDRYRELYLRLGKGAAYDQKALKSSRGN